MEEKKNLIEKYILRFLFGRNQYQNFPKRETLQHVILKQIKQKDDNVIQEDVNLVFKELKKRKIIIIEEIDFEISSEVKASEVEDLKSFTLTTEGRRYAIQKGYIAQIDLFEYIDTYTNIFSDYNERQGKVNKNVRELEEKIVELKKYTNPLSEKISLHEKKIKNFNNSIISIMAILIAAFSIIGFNIGGIKFIVESKNTMKIWEYAGSIGTINLCIIISLYFLFYLLNKIVNPGINSNSINKENNTKKGFDIFSIEFAKNVLLIVIVIIVFCFGIA